MKRVEDLFKAIGHLKFSCADYIVAGSAPLLIHGLRSEIQDLDIVTRGTAWHSTAKLHQIVQAPYDNVQIVRMLYRDTPVEILNGWFPQLMGWDVGYLVDNAETIQGVNFMPLRLTLSWKRALCRDRDFNDIRRIENFLSAEDA